MVCEAGSIHCKKKWPPKGFKLADFLKFLKLGLTEMTSASGRRPCVRAVYPSLAPVAKARVRPTLTISSMRPSWKDSLYDNKYDRDP